jgi:hypothetical protein
MAQPEQTQNQNAIVDATPNTVPTIPDDWAKLGLSFGYDPRLAEQLRLWIIGPSGEGKSTFNMSTPDNISLDFDGSAESIPGARACRVHVEDYEHYMAVTTKLIEDAKKGNRKFKRFSIDTVDEWVGMIINQLQTEKGVEDITNFGSEGHGWSLIRNRCWSRLRDLEQAGYVWSLIGHMTTKNETDPVNQKERTVLREAVFPSFAKKITTKCDFKLTVYCLPKMVKLTTKKEINGRPVDIPAGTKEVLQYFADSQTTLRKEGKSRAVPSMSRKIEIPLIGGWDVFAAEYNKAIEEAKKKYSSK